MPSLIPLGWSETAELVERSLSCFQWTACALGRKIQGEGQTLGARRLLLVQDVGVCWGPGPPGQQASSFPCPSSAANGPGQEPSQGRPPTGAALAPAGSPGCRARSMKERGAPCSVRNRRGTAVGGAGAHRNAACPRRLLPNIATLPPCEVRVAATARGEREGSEKEWFSGHSEGGEA